MIRQWYSRNPLSDTLLIDKTAAVTTLTLNRPDKANALDAALVEALGAAVEAAHHDGTRLLIFKGSGKHFCAGFDFGNFEKASEGDLLLREVIARAAKLIAQWQALGLCHGVMNTGICSPRSR